MSEALYNLGNGFFEVLHAHSSLMLFLVIGIGYLLGKIRFGSFSFGPVAGVLFASLFLGHFGFRITPGAQEVGFAMFIFSVGYQAGPRFFDAVKEDGLKYFLLAVVVASTGFLVALAGTSMMTLQPGTSAGVLAGGLTSSPTLAAAQDAVKHGMMKIPQGFSKDEVIGNIATGYAITYIFGLVGLISIIKLLPQWLGIDLVEEARRFTDESYQKEKIPLNPTSRCYQVTHEAITIPTIAELEEKYWDHLSVVRIIRDGRHILLGKKQHLQLGDRLEMTGPRRFFVEIANEFGKEVAPEWNISQVTETAQIIVLNKSMIGQTLGEIEIARRFGLLLLHIRQLGVIIPFNNDTKLKQGDILTVVGPADQIDKLGEALGQIERDISETDMVTFAFGIVAGVLIGMLSVEVAGVSIGLGSAGGLLATGLIIGHRRSHRPTFGRLPEAAQWILMEFGLLLFMTGVGLRAGGNIIETLQTAGPMLILAGICVTCLPIFIGYWFGRKVLKIEPVILFGAITGAMTSGASLAVVTGAAKSPIPALGYTGTYAFANVLLMVAGGLILIL